MNEISDSADMRNGLLCGITAYTIWGLFPIYFILTQSIPALELLGHRIIWSVFGKNVFFFAYLMIFSRSRVQHSTQASERRALSVVFSVKVTLSA